MELQPNQAHGALISDQPLNTVVLAQGIEP